MHELITLRRRLRALGFFCLLATAAAAWGWLRGGEPQQSKAPVADGDLERLEKRMSRRSYGDRLRALRRLSQSAGEQAAASAIALYRSAKSHRIRLAAIAQLGRIGTDSALRELEEIFEVGNPALAPAAIAAIGRIGNERAERWLLARLEDDTPRWRRQVVAALGELSSEGSVVALIKLARDQHESVRLASIRALGASGSAAAFAPLMALLDDEVEDVQRAALAGLGRLGLPRARDALMRFVKQGSRALREEAIAALADYDDDRVRELMVRLARDKDPKLATAAIKVLRRSDATLSRQALASALKSSASDVRFAAASALAAEGDPDARTVLEGLLNDPRHDYQAARELAELGDADAQQTLMDTARTGGRRAAAAAMAALSTVKGPEVEKTLEALIKNGPSHVRGRALTEIVRRQGKKARPLLERLYREGSPWSRQQALSELVGQMGKNPPAEMRSLLREAAWSGDSSIASAAVDGLAKLGDEGRDAMVELLRNGSRANYYGLVNKLAEMGGSHAREALLAELQDKERAPRAYGVGYALGSMRDPETRQRLRQLVDDPSTSTFARQQALQALARQGDVEALKSAAGHQDDDMATTAFTALARRGGEEAQRILVDATNAGSEARRRAALSALGTLGTPEATQSLAQALHDKGSFDAAAAGLARMGTADALRALRDRYASSDNEQRERLIQYVSSSPDRRAREMVEQGLSDAEPRIAAAAARALINMGGARIHERIETLLHSSQAAVRRAAAQQLRWRRSALYWRHEALIKQVLAEPTS